MKNKLLVLALLLITVSTQAQVGKWLLNNNANDATSNAINGTLTGSPTFSTSSKEGAYALVVNGTSQYVDLGNPSLFPSGTAARTISAWATTNNVSGSRSIFAYGTNSTSKAMVIGQNGTSLIGGAFASNLTVTNFWATGVWHHICLTYDGTTAKLYADGSLVASQAMSWSLTLAKAYIGRGVNSSDYWSGSIDDVRIYNTALTATQVQTIATAPPSVPTGLTATSTAPTSASLSWTDASTDETGFSVERSTTTGTGFSVLTTTAANATSYTDATTTEGTNYFYRIQSINAGGSSVYTSEATVTTLPNAPTGLTATTASATSITLNWTDASSKETGYDIERSLTSGSGFSVVGTAAANAITYIDASLATGTTYYYRIKSKVGTVGSSYTVEANATTAGFDSRAGATTIAHSSSWISSDAAYTTVGATADGSTISCAGVYNNVWFKFQATSTEAGIKLRTGDTKGTLAYSSLTLQTESGSEIACYHGNNPYDIAYIQTTSLTIGSWYYISVDSRNGSLGTFSLEVTNNMDYDFRGKAVAIPHTNSWLSSDASYSNVGATADGTTNTCYATYNNVWFKFQATSTEAGIKLRTGDAKGTLGYSSLTLQAESGSEIACYYGNNPYDIAYIQTTSLTIGSWYYISVDSRNGSLGTFSLEVTNNMDYDFRGKAVTIPHTNSWLSSDASYSNIGATVDGPTNTCYTTSNNVWFKFQATTSEVGIKVRTGGTKGTLGWSNLVLQDASGNQIACKLLNEQGVDIIKRTDLTIGSWYYFSVASYNGTDGTFTVELSNSTGNDFKQNATLLTDFNNWSSGVDAYTNLETTPDETSGTCATINRNIWFKFQATTNSIDIKLQTGGAAGNLRTSLLTLYDALANPLACDLDVNSNRSYAEIKNTTLTLGAWYYFSVDDQSQPGTFSLFLDNGMSYDFKSHALLLSDLNNWSSANAAYSNVGATPDEVVGSQSACVAPNHNVWFKFQATTNEVEIKALTSGTNGTIGYITTSLFDASGNTIACHNSQGGLVSFLQITTLTPGSWYYFSVDNAAGGQGTFSLQINNTIGFDLKAKATTVPHTSSWSSALEAYTNADATPDDVVGSQSACVTPNHNVWFKFQATTSDVEIRALTSGSSGTIGYISTSLFDASGNTIACHYSQGGLVSFVKVATLTPGSWYYFSVDNAAGGQGTFSLQVANHIGFDFRSEAVILTDLNNWSSGDAAYTNVGATGTGFNEEPNVGISNVWFKFQATTNEIDFRILTGGTKGTINEPQVYMYGENGNRYSDISGYTDIQRIDLTPGSFYYFMIDVGGMAAAGTFTVQISDQVGYNMRAKAELLTNLNNWSSIDAAYSNVGTTGKGFNEEPNVGNSNVWFKFQATTNEIDFRILTGGTKGTINEPQVYMYDENGNRYSDVSGYTDVQRIDLTPGSFYYFMINVGETAAAGAFTVQINDHVNYNMRAKAELLTNISDWKSQDAGYSNDGATGKGFNEELNAGLSNVWFKFLATTNKIDIKVLTGDGKGTLNNPRIILYDNDGTIIANDAEVGHTVSNLTTSSLVVGSDYYFSIDNDGGTSSAGTFSLELGGGLSPNALCSNIYCTDNGGIGIGTAVVPTGYALAVNGKVIMEGAKVEVQSKWPDYVFEKDYPITEIAALKKYIEEHGHLPNVPSAKTVEKEGIDVEAINIALLQKIEELSLYLIKMEERLKKLEKENNALRNEKAGNK